MAFKKSHCVVHTRRSTNHVMDNHTQDDSKIRKLRTSEADIRNAHLKKGALLLKFEFKYDVDQHYLRIWRSIEKKGFLVSDSGCLIPSGCHMYGNSKKKPAYVIALALFKKLIANPNTKGTFNEFHWPSEEQVSHLCHWNDCSSYKDLELEPKFKNQKRNFCGFDGSCDCGCLPKCKCRYLPSNIERNTTFLDYSTPRLASRLAEFFDDKELGISVKLLPSDYFIKEDLVRTNRNKRVQQKKKQDAACKKRKRKIENTEDSNPKYLKRPK